MTERPSVPEIRARLEAATPGPWRAPAVIMGLRSTTVFAEGLSHLAYTGSPANAEFIAHAPTDIAFLLDRLSAVREYVDDPGNWSALDGRRQVLLDLIDGSPNV